MNIRSLSNPALVSAQEKVETQRRDLKSDQTTDRDGNGQQAFGDGDEHRPLTEEEVQQVLEKLRGHEGITKHNLSVQLSYQGTQPIVSIMDQDQKVIKRLTERHLFQYLFQDQGEPLSLVRRTA